MKRRVKNHIVWISSDEFLELVGNNAIKLEFFDDSGWLKNGTTIEKVQFLEYDEDQNDGKANIFGVLVNNCRNKTHVNLFERHKKNL